MSDREQELTEAWSKVADWCAYDLAHDGEEGIVLGPVARHRAAAAAIAVAEFGRSEFEHRKLAALLVGRIEPGEEKPSLLEIFLEEERARDAVASHPMFRLETQSVLEDIVGAARRWARIESSRAAGLRVLRQVVERTVAGEYCNTASEAMATLYRYAPAEHQTLLEAFVRRGARAAPSLQPVPDRGAQSGGRARPWRCQRFDRARPVLRSTGARGAARG